MDRAGLLRFNPLDDEPGCDGSGSGQVGVYRSQGRLAEAGGLGPIAVAHNGEVLGGVKVALK